MLHKLLWAAVACLTLVLALLLYQEKRSSEITASIPVECDLNLAACRLPLAAGGTLKLSISPMPIPVVTPLTIRLESGSGGESLKAAVATFTGVEMDMGLNRFVLEAQSDGSLQGLAMLPVCSRTRMMWSLSLMVETEQGRSAYLMQFNSVSSLP